MSDAAEHIAPEAKETDDVAASMARLAVALGDSPRSGFTNGDRAALRRLSPVSPDARHLTALARALATVNPRPADAEAVLCWSIIINALAVGRARSHTGRPLGRVLHAAGVTEARLEALLAADPATLADLAPRIARRLDQSGEAGSVNWVQFARLVLTAAGEDADARKSIRLQIARDWLAGATSSPQS